MSISINPLDLIKIIGDYRKDEREPLLTRLDAVQREARSLLDVWVEIQKDLNTSDTIKLPAAYQAIRDRFTSQAVGASYLREFYRYVSLASQDRIGPDIMQALVAVLGRASYQRNIARAEIEELLTSDRIKELTTLSEDNRRAKLHTVQDAIETLQKELVALDVFIQTIRANPKAFRK